MASGRARLPRGQDLRGRFEKADATALDVSLQMRHHLRTNAGELGLSERVRTVQT